MSGGGSLRDGLNRGALDRYITGNYGEDQFKDEPPEEKCHVCGVVFNADDLVQCGACSELMCEDCSEDHTYVLTICKECKEDEE